MLGYARQMMHHDVLYHMLSAACLMPRSNSISSTADRLVNKQLDRQTALATHHQTDRQTDRQTERQKDNPPGIAGAARQCVDHNVLQLVPHVMHLMPGNQGRHNHVSPEDSSLLLI